MKEKQREKAAALFTDPNVSVVLADFFLGGFIGKGEEVQCLLKSKIEKWIHAVECLSWAAQNYPQAAYAAFTHSLSMDWTYLQRMKMNLNH